MSQALVTHQKRNALVFIGIMVAITGTVYFLF
ncbi:hypothetical protein AAA799P11_00041 [Marine Group I thaumarchaeote SCGC AAA799-P11]|uniref:Uncharacterized protein n=1 Tax=Marine Group I thaumarchaeote SCGC AAA799-P11 TaxID=1502295 RepID=A0A087S3J0_9ARCH|nr:hypothetical protein AAA799P11_00041 [Marine Group I thaumarchaeote SCGC AAA799-P11]